MAESRDEQTASLELATVYEVSKILVSNLDLARSLREVLTLLSSYLNMRRGTVSLVEDDMVRVVASSGMSQEEISRGRMKIGEGVLGRIVKTGMPVVVPNLAEEPLFLNRTGARDDLEDEPVSLVGVPIKAGAQVIGALTIDRLTEGQTRPRYDADTRFLAMVANLIGQTVRLHETVAQEREQILQEKFKLQKEIRGGTRYQIDDIVGQSPAMQDVFAQVHKVAPFRSTVLIRGESGTGKELIARAIHHLSPRKDGPFIRLNCAALPETLLEAELFGHEKGAFTGANTQRKGRFELADHGTLFLDEIGDISAGFQAKLLRVLQEREFERVGGSQTLKTDVRLVAATNVDLERAVAEGRFRADLYFRINVVTVNLPPLRERKEDIPALVQHFLDKFNEENGRQVGLSQQALAVFKGCHWPGNVRELENCVERSATLCRDDLIRDADLACQNKLCLSSSLWRYKIAEPAPEPARPTPTPAAPPPAPPPMDSPPPPPDFPTDPGPPLDDEGVPDFESEKDRLIWAMDKCGWVQAKAARLLNMTPRQIGYALRKHDIELKRL